MVEDIFDVSLRCTPFLAKSDDIPLEFINDYLKKLESAEEIVA